MEPRCGWLAVIAFASACGSHGSADKSADDPGAQVGPAAKRLGDLIDKRRKAEEVCKRELVKTIRAFIPNADKAEAVPDKPPTDLAAARTAPLGKLVDASRA